MTLLSQEDAEIATAPNGGCRTRASWPRMVSTMLTAALLFTAQPGLRQANAVSPDLSTAPGVLADPLSARALFGFDAVSYFIDGSPRTGHAELVYRWRGADWHFVNRENLERFRAAPELYAPQLAGMIRFGRWPGSPLLPIPRFFSYRMAVFGYSGMLSRVQRFSMIQLSQRRRLSHGKNRQE